MVSPESSLLRQDHLAWLVGQRGLDEEVIARFRLASRGNRIGFPYRGLNGGIVKGKWLAPFPADGEPKWTADKGGETRLFNEIVLEDQPAFKTGTPLVLTEGEVDCLTAVQAGFQHAVSLQNGAITTLAHEGMRQFHVVADHLRDIRRFILAVDDDAKGLECREVLLGYLGKGRCCTVEYPTGCKDLNDVLQKHGIEAVRSVLTAAKPYPLKGVFKLDDYPRQPALQYYATDIPGLSGNYGRGPAFAPHRGSLVTIFGPAYHGKSTLAWAAIGDWVRKFGMHVCVAALEEPLLPFIRERLVRYYYGREQGIVDMAGVNAHPRPLNMVGFNHTGEAYAAADPWIQQHFTFLDHDAGNLGDLPTLDWILDSADDVIMRHGADVLLIDPWTNLDLGGQDSVREEAKALAKLKSFARTRNVVALVVTHPNREAMRFLNGKSYDGKRRKLTMHDIAGGRHWEGMSDIVVSVWREDLNLSVVSVVIEKAKFPGSGHRAEIDVTYIRGLEYFVPTKSAGIDNVEDLDCEGQRALQ